jgi:uncharacterized protein YqgQ
MLPKFAKIVFLPKKKHGNVMMQADLHQIWQKCIFQCISSEAKREVTIGQKT